MTLLIDLANSKISYIHVYTYEYEKYRSTYVKKPYLNNF